MINPTHDCNLCVQILSRQRPAVSSLNAPKDKEPTKRQPKIPELEEFLDNRDYTGAITLLEVCFIGLHWKCCFCLNL